MHQTGLSLSPGANLDSNLRTNELEVLDALTPNKINMEKVGSPAWIQTTNRGPRTTHALRRKTSAEFLLPNAMQFATAYSKSARRPGSGT